MERTNDSRNSRNRLRNSSRNSSRNSNNNSTECFNNIISLNSYPRVRKITLNQQEYDAKTLVQLMSMFEKNRWVLPHSRRKISDKEIFKIIAKSIENKTLQKKAEKVIDKYFKAKEKEEQEIRSLINQLPSWTF